MLEPHNTVLVIVDIQEKLVRAMHAREDLIYKAQQLVQGARTLNVPIICTEQNPKGLGSTVPDVLRHMPGVQPISKFSFSCCASEAFMQAMRQADRKNVLLAGIEAHVCVYQTAAELAAEGFHVEVVADACSSRTNENKHIGIEKCRDAGASVSCVETALFELLRVAEGPQFKQILTLVK
jgi:nicotinamidase-related amidase